MTASEYAGEADTREFVGGFTGLAPDASAPEDASRADAATAAVDLLTPPEGMRDVDAELAAPPRAKLPRVTLLLAAGVLLAGGFFAGVKVDRWQNGTSGDTVRGTAGGTGRQNAAGQGQTAGGTAGAAAGQGGGRAGAAGAGAGATVGTVKLVDGSTVYVTDASGTIVKVTTNADTKIQVSQNGKPADLKPGDTVVVRGAAGDDGTVAASTVTQSQAGTGLTAGGFGGAGTGAGTAAGAGAGAGNGTGGGTRAGTGSGRG